MLKYYSQSEFKMKSIEDKIDVYIICPVRSITSKEKEFLDNYVDNLEKQGMKCHYPPRDVNQNDPTGMRIMTEHRAAMKISKEVHAYWNPESAGSIGDLCMAWALDKPIKLINKQEIKDWIEQRIKINPDEKSHTRWLYEIDKFYNL